MQYYSAMKKKKRKFSTFSCKNILNGKRYKIQNSDIICIILYAQTL